VPKKLAISPERIFLTADHKWGAVIDEISSHVSAGRAVLVGTRSIRESEALHIKLKEYGIDSTVLNALRHEQEAEIIAHAGRRNIVTIATNMAGRGTDILVDREVLNVGDCM